MAHHTNHRRNLAAPPDPETPINPTHKRHYQHPKPTPSTTTNTKPHPDPTTTSSIQNISNHFSNLYRNHRAHSSLKPTTETQPSQAKGMTLSAIDDPSTTSLIKSNPQYRKHLKELKESMRVRAKVADDRGGEVKKLPKKGSEKDSDSDDVEKSDVSLAMIGGKRRSFCSTQTELADFFSCSGVKVVSVDMPPFMQVHAVDCARKTRDSMEKFTHKTLALTLKKEFDGVYGPAWHCIVGTSFGSFVTHSVGGFFYFSMDHKIYVLLFKTTVQRAE